MAVSKETLEKHLIQVRRIAEHREAKAEQNIRYYFAKLKKDLNSFLGNEYAKLAEDDKLTYAILQQKGEYARFLEEVISKVDGISPKLRSEVQSLVEETYKTCYKGLVKGVENIDDMAGLAKEFKAISAISPETVKRAVQNPIKKLTLNSTLERNRKQVISNIRREINIGLTQGDRMSTMAGRISKHVEQDYRKSMLIARTEAHRVRESGFNDAAESVDTILSENDSEFRMVKTWRNMRDGAVRHTNLANHVEMEGVTVLQDEDFELSDGSTAPCPGSSGVAAQDCNCRCYLARRIMSDEEYYRETGKHFSAKAFTNQRKRDIISSRGDTVALENQRYGRNKSTVVNKTYIESGEYRRKFDKITNSTDANRTIYTKAKEMLKHRSGTLFEDMYWIDGASGEIIASALNETTESAIAYSESIKKAIKGKENIIAIHTHPHSMPPSVADFNSACFNNYAVGVIACHDGKVFCYVANTEISDKVCAMYAERFLNQGYTEFEAQIKALEKLKESGAIDFWEVQ